MRRVVFLLHGGKCFLSGQELEHRHWEVHHIKHQRQHPHLRYDLDNCVPLAKTVHDLDHKGELNRLIRDKIGDEAYYELTRRAHVIVRVDLDKIEQDLKEILRRGRQ